MLKSVDVSGAQPKLLDTLKLDSGWSHELLLSGNHLLILSRGGYWMEPLPAMSARMMPISPSNSVITEVDVSDPKALKVVKTLTLDGAYVDARMVGSTVRIVTSSPMPVELPFVTPANPTVAGLAAAKAKNATVVKSSRVKAWLPYYRLGRQKSHAVVQCRDVRRPVAFSGLGMLTVLTIDLSKGLAPVDSVAVMTDGRIVYASPTSLYVSTENWASRPDPSTPTQAPSTVTTTIHKFDISDPTKTVYLGSGSVQGYLLNQWSLSDFQGVLRVVSTDAPAWWGSAGTDTQSYLTTFQQGTGGLVQAGRVGGLGQGEKVYAVRFIGNDGYVVTFKQVDPLYTLDLSDPAHPQVLGELTIPGYSAYLHPIGDNLLLGIGQNVDPTTNEPTGTQVSLFDVSDLKHPTLLYGRRSARAGRRPSPTTTRSSTGRRPASSSSRSASRPSACTSPARPASPSSAGSCTPKRTSRTCPRSTARSSSAPRCSPSRTSESRRAASRRSRVSAGPGSRRRRRRRHLSHCQARSTVRRSVAASPSRASVSSNGG